MAAHITPPSTPWRTRSRMRSASAGSKKPRTRLARKRRIRDRRNERELSSITSARTVTRLGAGTLKSCLRSRLVSDGLQEAKNQANAKEQTRSWPMSTSDRIESIAHTVGVNSIAVETGVVQIISEVAPGRSSDELHHISAPRALRTRFRLTKTQHHPGRPSDQMVTGYN